MTFKLIDLWNIGFYLVCVMHAFLKPPPPPKKYINKSKILMQSGSPPSWENLPNRRVGDGPTWPTRRNPFVLTLAGRDVLDVKTFSERPDLLRLLGIAQKPVKFQVNARSIVTDVCFAQLCSSRSAHFYQELRVLLDRMWAEKKSAGPACVLLLVRIISDPLIFIIIIIFLNLSTHMRLLIAMRAGRILFKVCFTARRGRF